MVVETKPYIPKLDVKVSCDSTGIDMLRVEAMGKSIPIYSARNPNHHELIARATASGEPVAFFAVGLFGVLLSVDHPRIIRNAEAWRKFWDIKRGRELKDKVPVMVPPKHLPRIFDVSKLHPDFRYLKDQEAWSDFYGPLPMHVIGPVKESAGYIHSAFITTSEESKKKPLDQHVEVSTVCAYFQNDPDWLNIALRATKYNPHALFGVTSFNDHGEAPPFNFNEMIDYVRATGRVDFSYIVRDEIAENANVRSSHTQIRLPLWYERPELLIIRKGAVSPEWISRQTGHPVRVLESARVASRGHDNQMNLDPLVENYLQGVKVHLAKRKS